MHSCGIHSLPVFEKIFQALSTAADKAVLIFIQCNYQNTQLVCRGIDFMLGGCVDFSVSGLTVIRINMLEYDLSDVSAGQKHV